MRGRIRDRLVNLVLQGLEHRQLTTDHLRHQFEAGQLGSRVFADEAAIAQHGDAVGDAVDLLEEVSDEQHGHT